jgi:hypothetical protein
MIREAASVPRGYRRWREVFRSFVGLIGRWVMAAPAADPILQSCPADNGGGVAYLSQHVQANEDGVCDAAQVQISFWGVNPYPNPNSVMSAATQTCLRHRIGAIALQPPSFLPRITSPPIAGC